MAKNKSNNRRTTPTQRSNSYVYSSSSGGKVARTGGQYSMVGPNKGKPDPQVTIIRGRPASPQTRQTVDESAWEKAAMEVLDEFEGAWRQLADS